MRTHLMSFVLALCLIGSAASLIGSEASAGNGPGCCICTECGFDNNSTTMGLDMAATSCFPATDEGQCASLCSSEGCIGLAAFNNATCSAPVNAQFCDPNVMAPAASSWGLIALASLLAGAGAFYLRRRSA